MGVFEILWADNRSGSDLLKWGETVDVMAQDGDSGSESGEEGV